MNNKLNIDELKYLIPDYITGDISDSDKAQLEDALKQSAELRGFYAELKGAFDFAGTVKHQEPSPQYWSSLLPRIHQRIEEQEAKEFSWDKVASIWKVLVPIAAIIVIALIYYLVQPSNTQLTKDEENKNEKKNEQKINNDKKNEQKINNDSSDKDKNPEKNQDNIVKETPKKNFIKRDRTNDNRENNTVNKEDNQANDNQANDNQANDNQANDNQTLPEPNNEDIAAIEVEETSVFSEGEAAGFDEEIENDLKKLDDNEQNMLLEELKTSNL